MGEQFEVGQVWRPASDSRALPKKIVRISKKGVVYVVKWPRIGLALPTGYRTEAFRAWIRLYGATLAPTPPAVP